MTHAGAPLLDVQHLTTVFDVGGREVRAVDDVSFEVREGETLGLVGESGSGKSATALSLLRLVRPPGRIAAGRVVFQGRDLMAFGEADLRKVRGAGMALVFQEPASALNPVFTVGDQIAEAIVVHGLARGAEARRRAIALLAQVRIPDPERRANDFPHQLSGGMRQRVVIAMAIACRPALVVADEPTTALDATVQAQVLDLLRDLRASHHLSLLLISHDLGVIAGHADRVAVMYAGRIVEQGPVRQVLREPAHPYTRALIASLPRPGVGRLTPIEGAVPSIDAVPAGCAFHPRCPAAFEACTAARPEVVGAGPDHEVRCLLAGGQGGGAR